MSARNWLLVPSLMLAVACGADSDGDGLSNRDEKVWGTDLELADSDGDGLTDGNEVELGIDPVLPDSDGDGFDDGEEVDLGFDPADGTVRPYLGGWSVNEEPCKTEVEDGAATGPSAAVGVRFKRFTLVDQFGDMVDLYDFAKQGKPVVIDVSAEWCPPCNDLAAWMEEEGNDPWGDIDASVRAAVNDGSLTWITIMGESSDGSLADAKTSKRWYRDYKHPSIPVLADSKGRLVDFAAIPYWPTLFTLDENMVVTGVDDHALLNSLVE